MMACPSRWVYQGAGRVRILVLLRGCGGVVCRGVCGGGWQMLDFQSNLRAERGGKGVLHRQAALHRGGVMAFINSHIVALSKEEEEEEVFRSRFAVAIALLGEGVPRAPRELVQLADSVVRGGADGVPSCCELSA